MSMFTTVAGTVGGNELDRRMHGDKKGEKGAPAGKGGKKAQEKKWLIGGAVLVGAYLLYRWYENRNSSSSSSTTPPSSPSSGNGGGGGAPLPWQQNPPPPTLPATPPNTPPATPPGNPLIIPPTEVPYPPPGTPPQGPFVITKTPTSVAPVTHSVLPVSPGHSFTSPHPVATSVPVDRLVKTASGGSVSIKGTTSPSGHPQVEHVTVTTPPSHGKVSVGHATAITAPSGQPFLSQVHTYTQPAPKTTPAITRTTAQGHRVTPVHVARQSVGHNEIHPPAQSAPHVSPAPKPQPKPKPRPQPRPRTTVGHNRITR